MIKENFLIYTLLNELHKLSENEVSNFCGENYYKVTKKRFQSSDSPPISLLKSNLNGAEGAFLTFEVEKQFIEILILRSKWDVQPKADYLTYHFFLKDLSLYLFGQPNLSKTQSRQLISDIFMALWLLSLDAVKRTELGISESITDNLKIEYSSIQQEFNPKVNADDIRALLVCTPSLTGMEKNVKTIEASKTSQDKISGLYFEATSLKASRNLKLSAEAQGLEKIVTQYGLVELQILYKNGTIQPLKCNEDILAYLDNFRTEKADRRMQDKLCGIEESDSLLFKTFERNKLNLIDKFFSENQPINLVFGYDTSHDRPSLPCNSFQVKVFGGIYEKPNVSLKLLGGHGHLELKLEIPSSLENTIISNQVAYDFESKALIFHNFHQISREFSQFINKSNPTIFSSRPGEKITLLNTLKHPSNELPTNQHTFKELQTSFVYTGHQNIYNLLKNLHFELGTNVIVQHIEEHISESPEKIDVMIDRKSFRLNTPIKHKNLNLNVTNLCPEWKEVLCGINSGLVRTLPPRSEEKYLSTRRIQRQNEIKFLNHPGIFYTVLLTTLEWKLRHQELGKSKELFYEELWRKIYLLLSPRNELNQSEDQPSDLLSNKVIKIVIDYIETLTDYLDPEYESKVIFENEIVSIKGLFLKQSKVIFFWLNQLAGFSKGEILSPKGASKYLPKLWFEENLSLEEKVQLNLFVMKSETTEVDMSKLQFYSYNLLNPESKLALPLNLWAKLPQMFPEASISIDGHQLETISAENFIVNFELTNSGQNTNDENNRIDWFDLNPKYFLNGVEISEREAKKLTFEGVLEYQGRFYVLDAEHFPGQKALEVFWQRLQYNQEKCSKSIVPKNEETTTKKHHVLELLALRRMGINFTGPKEWEEICCYYDNLSQPRAQLDLGEGLSQVLKPYQLSGIQWLWDLYQLRIGGILADDMGLGKTVQALSFLQYGMKNKSIKKVLIIVPVSLTFNWIAEAKKFTPDINIKVFEPKDLDTINTDVVVCTYSLLSLHHQLFEKYKYDVVIFDEAQYLKNIGTTRFKSSEFIKAKFKVALTGTPIENNLSELYSLFHLVASGLLGNRQDFQRQYVKPEALAKESLEFLRAKLKPLILRRRKQDLSLELPDKTENQIYVDFTEKQKELYRNTALSWSQKVNEAINQRGSNQSKIYMLTALLRLRQVCSDPAALPSVKYDEIPPKVSILMDMLEEITEEGHSAIVFTQFMSTFTRLKDLLHKNHIRFYEMSGSTARKDREILLRDFSADHSEKGSVLLMTLKTGGVGLNLTKASYVFHLEPWWNPAVENQATDRVHRLGQNKNVTVYRMIMRESVEEKVELLKSRKSQLFNKLFGDDYFSLESINDQASNENSIQTAITKEDFDALIQ